MSASIKIFEATILLLLCLFAFGCTAHVVTGPSKNQTDQSAIKNPCNIPEGKGVDDVIEKTKSILAGNQCNEKFDDLYQNILSVAARDSKPGNRELFKGFIDWCLVNGTLYKNTARQIYGEYFSSQFMCLEKWPKICNQCPKIDDIERDMNTELKKKELGLLRICEDEARYNKAIVALNQEVVVLKAACMACSD